MITELRAAIRDDGQLRVIVLNASGAVFSSGHDLKELVRVFPSARCCQFNQVNIMFVVQILPDTEQCQQK